MRSMKKVFWSIFLGLPLVFCATALADDVDDEVPDVTARVSRISFIKGDVQIRRDGNQDWERAVLNLPIVEGDEITTDAFSRLEIQLNAFQHIRLAENSYLKFTGLRDGAVALSLSEGTMTVRLTSFDKDNSFFEVDAPKTTLAVQRAGMYRIDAGKAGGSEVRFSVTNDGEARVYAENSGFTLKNGRAATVRIDGSLSGEWNTDDVARYADEFDTWSLDRDAVIAKLLKDAYYDKYYDQDIYGAEDLRDYGEWVYTRKYGYVWKPYRSSTSSYVSWSPYRYGHWRWVPPFGWTWVNDEPWGWATYHHGRWFYDNGSWYWTPYGYVRRSRSWWSPALVGVTIINYNVCWYPLPHGYGYYNYNHYFGGWGGPRNHHNNGNWNGNNNGNGNGHNNGNGNGNGNGNPTGPTPTPPAFVGPLPGQVGPSVFADNNSRRTWFATPPMLRVPPGAVMTTALSSFGRDRNGITPAGSGEAQAVLSKALSDNKTGRILPSYQELDGRVSTAIKVEKPRVVSAVKPTGAAIRNADGGPMDRTLQNTKVFGDRTPIRPEVTPEAGGGIRSTEPRKTGAVTREPIRPEVVDAPVKPERTTRPNKDRDDDTPIRQEPARTPRESKPREDRNDAPVRAEPRVQRESKPREEPVRQPRNDPPPRSEPVRSEPVRSEPTRAPSPSKNESPKSEPSKSEPSKPAPSERKNKDG